jgi:hypothetical protein
VRLHCQRWVYRIGNSVVCVDNGFAWIGWAQERMVINDETVQISGGWFRMRQDFLEPWIVPGGEGTLAVRMVSGMITIHCSAELDGELLMPAETLKANWSGPKGTWPKAADWFPAKV